MNLSASDRWTILQNILAQAGGVANVDLHAELAKVMSGVNAMEAQKQMAMQQMAATAPVGGGTAPISSQGMGDMGQPVSEPEIPPTGQI